MADARFKQLMLLPTCHQIRAITLIQRIARGYLVRKARRSLIASIYRNLREEMDLLHEQLEEQEPFRKAFQMEVAKKAKATEAIVDLMLKQLEEQQLVTYVIDLTYFQPYTPTILAIEDGTP
jgi:hypothetical protein